MFKKIVFMVAVLAFALAASAATFVVHLEEGSYEATKLTLKLYYAQQSTPHYTDTYEGTVVGGQSYTFVVGQNDFFGTYKAQVIGENSMDSDTDVIVSPHPWNDNHFYLYLTNGAIPYDPNWQEEDLD
jgi:ABC-type transport system substrate-binding protein